MFCTKALAMKVLRHSEKGTEKSDMTMARPGETTTEALEVQALYSISRLISSAVNDIDTVFASILKILHDILQMERASIVLFDRKREQLRIRASYGLSHEEMQKGVYHIDEGITGRIFRSRQPFIVPDIAKEPLFLNRTGSRKTISKSAVSFIGVPIMLNESPEGVLSVDRLFGPEVRLEADMRFLMILSTLLSQFLILNRTIVSEKKQLRAENKKLKALLHARFKRHFIVGSSKEMQEVFWNIERVAPSRATVLLLGESGTGKELVARAIHEASPRHNMPFLRVNCAALPAALLESELFGHEKGAFTGAVTARAGRFELADGGTLFLDEIGEIPIELQAKMLRVLQEQQFERIGSTRTRKVDVRIIAATNVDLERAVGAGNFRADLYYRLNVVPLHLPPLRNRRDDIPLLLHHFLKLSNERNGRDIRMSREFLERLMEYDWPGNVRELQNLIERLVILATSDVLTLKDLKGNLRTVPDTVEDSSASEQRGEKKPVEAGNMVCYGESPAVTGYKSLEEIEKKEIEAALIRHGWVQIRAARELGLTQRQIGYRIKKYGIVKPKKYC